MSAFPTWTRRRSRILPQHSVKRKSLHRRGQRHNASGPALEWLTRKVCSARSGRTWLVGDLLSVTSAATSNGSDRARGWSASVAQRRGHVAASRSEAPLLDKRNCQADAGRAQCKRGPPPPRHPVDAAIQSLARAGGPTSREEGSGAVLRCGSGMPANATRSRVEQRWHLLLWLFRSANGRIF